MKFSPPPAPPPAPSTPSLSQRLHDLRAALAASPEDGPFDDALADQVISFWKDLGVPPSHPDIIDALAEGRMDDLPEIADRILAGAPP